ncbi:MAG: SdrD B-like domain-containing protein [Actinomycetota bacterium]
MRTSSRIRVGASGVGLTIAAVLGLSLGGQLATAPPAGAVGPACLDWNDYAAGAEPAGSGNLGVAGGASPTVDGETRTLTNVFGEPIDLRLTWVDEHNGVILDTTTGGDFTGVPAYTDLVGGDGNTSVLRYFPRADEGGTMHFEFFEAGTTNRVEVEIDQLLIGGHRDFPTRPEGVSELALTTGGPAGARVASTFADPDSVAVDTDPADGITGLGTEPIIELDLPEYGTANNTAYNEARDAFVSVGAFEDRDWTIIDWGTARADTIVWQLYGSDPNDDPETVDPAVSANHDGLSAYISGFCFTPDPSYDLALAKVLTSYDPSTRQATFTTTVRNQGGLDSGAFTVEDRLPAGLSFVSADNGGAEVSGGVVRWDVPAGSQLAFGETLDLTLVARVDDASLAPFTNTSEITADSGDDDDSTPDTDTANDNLVDITDASDLANDPGTNTPDEDDHDIAVLDLDFDLALSQTLTDAPADLGPGSDVGFEIKLTNQGPDVARVRVVNYVQDGFAFDPTRNPGGTLTDTGGDSYTFAWDTSSPDAPVATLTATAGSFSDGEMITIPVTLTVEGDWDGGALINWAEISDFDDDTDPANGSGSTGALTDVDSTPDTDQTNDNQPMGPGASGDDVITGDGDGTDPVADDEDDHDVAGVGTTHSIGNQVWLDADNDGRIDPGENGLAGVTVELFRDADDDGIADACDADGLSSADAVATATTDANGLYLFTDLAAGNYVVGVGPSAWAAGGPLRGLLSSDPTTADPDRDVDADDDGAPACGGYVVTGAITVGDGEPTGETPDNDATTPDARENLTVDLGFWQPRFDLALRKQLADGTNRTTVSVGDQVTFRITVFNQGSFDAVDVSVIDYVPDGLTLDDPDWALDSEGRATTALPGTLAAGASTTVDITFRVAAGATGSIENTAEITGATPQSDGDVVRMPNGEPLPDLDSTPDATDGETPVDDEIDGGGGDEDDHDAAQLDIGGGGELPRTGSEPRPMIVFAGALVLWGLVLLGLRPAEE